MNLQSLHLYVRYVPWAEQKIPIMSAYDEFLRRGERRRTRRTASADQLSTFRNGARMWENGSVEAGEGDRSVEVVLQVCNNALT